MEKTALWRSNKKTCMSSHASIEALQFAHLTVWSMTVFSTQDVRQHAERIMKAIIVAMKVKPYDLCICGSGKKLKQCCDRNAGAILFTETAFEKVLSYSNSQGGTVEVIPQGLFQNFVSNSTGRFKCLFPKCNQKTINCHLIPENTLRGAFGSFCMEARPQDQAHGLSYVKTGVVEAGTLPVFCGRHDNDLFEKIDNANNNFSSKEQQFLLAFKAVSFSLRRVQINLGIDFQVELYRPFLYLNKHNPPQGTHVESRLSKHFEEQYLRLKIIHDLFEGCLRVYEKNSFDQLQYLSRDLVSSEQVFFSGLVNPLTDLQGVRINDSKTPVNMTITGVTTGGTLRLNFASMPKSKALYAQLFSQLRGASDVDVQAFVDETMRSAHVMPIVACR